LVLEIEPVRKRFLAKKPQRFEVAKDRVLFHGAVIEILMSKQTQSPWDFGGLFLPEQRRQNSNAPGRCAAKVGKAAVRPDQGNNLSGQISR
jgi:hypothetical protein